MSVKNISKISSFVTIFLLFCFSFAGCGQVFSNNFNLPGQTNSDNSGESSNDYGKPKVIGTIDSEEITESSGLAASRCSENVFWTHNDSGDDAFIFAFNPKGKKLGTWRVAGAKNYDWEDMATFKTPAGECFLYIADIGNNVRERSDFIIYRVREPVISPNNSSRKNPLPTDAAEAIKIEYPDMARDAETLMVHPQTGDVYILTKRLSGASGVYKLPADYNREKVNKLEKISDFSVPATPNGFLTGGEISPDGTRVIICDYFRAYELVLPTGKGKKFDDIWKEKPLKIELGERAQGEAVAYSVDGKSIYATSEKKKSPIIEVRQK